MNRICWPTAAVFDGLTTEAKDSITNIINMDSVNAWLKDISISYPVKITYFVIIFKYFYKGYLWIFRVCIFNWSLVYDIY